MPTAFSEGKIEINTVIWLVFKHKTPHAFINVVA